MNNLPRTIDGTVSKDSGFLSHFLLFIIREIAIMIHLCASLIIVSRNKEFCDAQTTSLANSLTLTIGGQGDNLSIRIKT